MHSLATIKGFLRLRILKAEEKHKVIRDYTAHLNECCLKVRQSHTINQQKFTSKNAKFIQF